MKAAAWTTALLREVTTKIGTGATPRGGSDAYKATGIPLIRSLNVYDDGFREEGLAYLDDEQASRLDHVIVQEGDVLLNITGASVARCCVAPEQHLPARVNQHVSIIRPRADILCHQFLRYLLIAGDCKKRLLDTGEGGGTTRQAITKAQLQDFRIAFPPIPEQRRIVAILDEAFEGIAAAKANAEENIGKCDLLHEQCSAGMFRSGEIAWPTQPLSEICPLFVDSAHRTPKYQDDGLPALRPRDVVGGVLDLSGAARVSQAEYEIQTKRYQPKPGDIVYSRELSFGWAAMIPPGERVCLSQGMCVFRPSPEIDPGYLLHILNGPIGRGQAIKSAVGSSHPHVNLSAIRQYRIPVPQLSEQQAIRLRMDAVASQHQSLRQSYKTKLSALDELRASVFHEAFTGNL